MLAPLLRSKHGKVENVSRDVSRNFTSLESELQLDKLVFVQKYVITLLPPDAPLTVILPAGSPPKPTISVAL